MSHPVHFSSKINVVPEYKFRKLGITELQNQGLTSESPWESADRISFAPKAATVGAYICNAGGFQNGRHMTLFHLCPYENLFQDRASISDETWMDVADALAGDIRQLKAENPNLRGFLTGGSEKDADSRTLKEHLLELFKDFGIPVSIIWGSKSKEDLHYDTQTDTWTIVTSGMPHPTFDDLKKKFPLIHIDPGDQLFIDGKKVSKRKLRALSS